MRGQGFSICDGKGFHIGFENGYTISVQFGPGNYCDNYDMRIGHEDGAAGKRGSMTAECAVISPQGNLIELPGCSDSVTNRSSPAEVLELMKWTAAQGGAMEQSR
jgi:hypothetical protein